MFECDSNIIKSFVNDKLVGRILDVTEYDIKEGKFNNSNSCAIALSIKRIFDHGQDIYIGPDLTEMTFEKDVGTDKQFFFVFLTHSDEVRDWIKSFDKNEASPVMLEIVRDPEGIEMLVIA